MEQLSQVARDRGTSSPGLRRPAPATPAPGVVLAIVCAGVILASLDLFIVNVALPDIARDFGHASLGELSWVLNGYAIVYASLLVFFGRLADRHRRNYGFLLGVAIFTAASAACAAATSVPMLVAFRLVQAAGAALLTPTSLGLVLASYPAERRGGAVRTWTAIGGLAAALGPVVGGLLVTVSWRWVFLVNVPIGVAALVVGWLKLPDVPGHPVPRPDALGAVLVTAGVGALTFGLVQGSTWGWGSAGTVAALAASVILLGLFAAHCATSAQPAGPARAVPGAQLLRRLAGDDDVLDRVRRDAALDRAVGAERLGLVGAQGGAGHRPRADHGPGLLVPGGRAAHPALRPGRGRHPRPDRLRGRRWPGGRSRPRSSPTTPGRCWAGCCSPGRASG